MRSTLSALLLSGLLLAGCGSDTPSGSLSLITEEKMAPAPPPGPVVEQAMADDASGGAVDNLPQRAGLYLAYTYSRSIEVPGDSLKLLLEEHAKACQDAGPKACLVTNSNVYGLGTDYARGSLNLKAAPDWTTNFLDTLSKEIESKGASVKQASKSSVDLTAQIIDTDARLKAQKTLRDRLQKLLETRDGKLEELLGVERELSRVQGEIDSHEATLANLRQRVAMSDINISYTAKVTPASRSVWKPLTSSFGDFFGNIAYALAGIVTLAAFLLPWVPVIFLAVLFVRYLIRVLRRSKAKRKNGPVSETVSDPVE